MTLRHLRIFIEVCDVDSMTRAAENMHMTQPSVSQAIAELEEHYGVRLFERLNRRLFLTEAGEKLLIYAMHMVGLNEQIEREMKRFNKVFHLRIGASITIGETIFARVLNELCKSYPENQLTSEVYNTAILEERLLKDKLDIALIEGNVSSEYLIARPFMDDELIFAASPQHPLANRKSVQLAEVMEYDFLLREKGSGTRSLFEQRLAASGMQCRITGCYSNATAIKQVVETGIGITVISKMNLQKELANGELCQLNVKNIELKRKFSIVYHQNKYQTAEMKSVEEICQGLSARL